WAWGEAAARASLVGESLALGEDRYALLLDDGPGMGASCLRAGRLRSLAWFGRRELTAADDQGGAVRVACDHRLERACLTWEDGRLGVELDPAFGRVTLSGAGLPETTEVGGL